MFGREVWVEGPRVVSFSGELDVWREGEFEAALGALEGDRPVVIDLAEVRYLDSAFLSALVRLRRRLPHAPITLVVAAPSVRRVLDLTQMSALFEIVPRLPGR